MPLHCGAGEDSWKSPGQQGDQTNPSKRKSVLNIHWKDWCWSWNSSTLATWCKELTHWKRPWMLGKIEGRRRGWLMMRCLDDITDSKWMYVWVTPGDSEELGSLTSCSPWARRELDMTKQQQQQLTHSHIPSYWQNQEFKLKTIKFRLYPFTHYSNPI